MLSAPRATAAAEAGLPAQVDYFGKLRYAPLDRLHASGKRSESVILIVIDACRPDHLGAYGYGRPLSPNIDALADEGLIFTNHFSDSSWTRPSTASIYTGLPWLKHRTDGFRNLKESLVTLAERFGRAGFATAGFVANPVINRSHGFGRGFDHLVDTGSWSALKADGLVDQALAWMHGVEGKRFFLVLFLVDVHDPYAAPAPYRKRFEPARVPRRTVEREVSSPLPKEVHDGLVGAYDAEIAFVDHELGRFFAGLRKRDLLERTTIALTADHGEAFGEHLAYRHAFHHWDEVLRTPLIIRSPNFRERGKRVDLPFIHHDLALTLLHAAGLPLPADLRAEGVDILEALGDPAAYARRERILLHAVEVHGIHRVVLRSRTGKLVVHYPSDRRMLLERFKSLSAVPSAVFDREKHIYFHLIDDPKERAPLSPSAHPEGRRLEGILSRIPGVGTLREKAVDPKVMEHLKALGY